VGSKEELYLKSTDSIVLNVIFSPLEATKLESIDKAYLKSGLLLGPVPVAGTTW